MSPLTDEQIVEEFRRELALIEVPARRRIAPAAPRGAGLRLATAAISAFAILAVAGAIRYGGIGAPGILTPAEATLPGPAAQVTVRAVVLSVSADGLLARIVSSPTTSAWDDKTITLALPPDARDESGARVDTSVIQPGTHLRATIAVAPVNGMHEVYRVLALSREDAR